MGSYDHNPLPLLVVYTHQIWKLRPQSTSFTGGLHTPNMEVTTTIHFLYWWSTHTKYGSYDHNPLPLLVVYTHQIWKLRPQSTSFTGGLHTPNMEVTTTIHFLYWWSTHTKYGSYDHNPLPLLVVYTHQIWKLRPQHPSFTGSLHTPNTEVTTTTPFLYWWSTHTKYGSYDHNTLPLLVVYTH